MRLRSLLLLCSPILFTSAQPLPSFAQAPVQKPAPKASTPAPKTPATPAGNPQSTHYPILLLGHGADPSWDVMIGQRGPERFDRANYPPIALDPVNVDSEGTGHTWAYHAKDSATGADVTIHLTRESCVAPASSESLPKPSPAGKPAASALAAAQPKDSFSIVLVHAQVGTFHGCARIAAELFPKIVNQSEDDDDDTEKKKPPVTTIANFKSPTATAFVNPAGKIIVSRGAAKKIGPTSGTDLALSHDGKKLLFTRNDSKMGSERTIVLYDFDTGRSRDLVHGALRQPFWSPDDGRVAYLQAQDQKWHILSLLPGTPENSTPLYTGTVDSLDGWTDGHTVLAADSQSLYWISDDRPQQTLSLKEIYGDGFRISDSDTIRVNPINPDLLLVSARLAAAPANAADASAVFLYEIRARRRVTITPAEQWATHGEWSRDGIQIFYTRRLSASSSMTYRVFWDGSAARRYLDGTDFVVGQ
jgi:hypothetical protein